jgi:hypothetical protein
MQGKNAGQEWIAVQRSMLYAAFNACYSRLQASKGGNF